MILQEDLMKLLHDLQEIIKYLSNEDYQKKIPVLMGSSIGQHCRHIIEFINSLVQLKNQEILCYDDRKRDVELESNIQNMHQFLEELYSHLPDLPKREHFYLKHLLPNQKEIIVETSMERELLFCLDHTIHHFAILRIGIEYEFPHIPIKADFGYTPSTIKSQKTLLKRF